MDNLTVNIYTPPHPGNLVWPLPREERATLFNPRRHSDLRQNDGVFFGAFIFSNISVSSVVKNHA